MRRRSFRVTRNRRLLIKGSWTTTPVHLYRRSLSNTNIPMQTSMPNAPDSRHHCGPWIAAYDDHAGRCR